MVVVDASVAVKWFLEEQDSDRVAHLLHGQQALCAPQIIFLEVFSAFCKRARVGSLKKATAKKLCDRWFLGGQDIFAEIFPPALFIQQAYTIALEYNHALPDCFYLAVALQEHLPLLTFDVRLAHIAKALNIPTPLQHIN
jgi:predicted nucleic acid-binding protein